MRSLVENFLLSVYAQWHDKFETNLVGLLLPVTCRYTCSPYWLWGQGINGQGCRGRLLKSFFIHFCTITWQTLHQFQTNVVGLLHDPVDGPYSFWYQAIKGQCHIDHLLKRMIYPIPHHNLIPPAPVSIKLGRVIACNLSMVRVGVKSQCNRSFFPFLHHI